MWALLGTLGGGPMSESEQRPYQVMPDLDAEEYDRLKRDIAENGVEYPIIVDTDGEIIDGHHRYQAWVDLGRDPEDLPRRVADGTDTEQYHRAYRTNLNRRDLTDGTKREVVKQYLLERPDRVAEDTQADIAADLGIGQSTVDRAVTELRDSGNLTQVGKLSTEERRAEVREYVEANPTASDREVAREVDCDVSHPTVGTWRDEWDSDDPGPSLPETPAADELPADSTADDAQPSSQSLNASDDRTARGSSDDADRGDVGESTADVGLFTSDETDEWSSPRELVEPLDDAVGGFDLDPCSGAESSPFAEETYTEADDGLSQRWHGTVWVNPPYSEMADWTAKAVTEAERDAVDGIYYLCKGDSSTDWWHDALGAASMVVHVDHRLSFGDGGNSAPFASHIFVFGTPDEPVLRELNRHGAVLTDLRIGGEPDE